MRIVNLLSKLKKPFILSPISTHNPVLSMHNMGSLFFHHEENRYSWSGRVHNIATDYELELKIIASDISGPTQEQLDEVVQLSKQYPGLKSVLLYRLKKYFLQKGQTISLEELEKSFFWAAVELSEDLQWQVLLEPAYKVASPFDFFPQFRLYQNRILWTNFENW